MASSQTWILSDLFHCLHTDLGDNKTLPSPEGVLAAHLRLAGHCLILKIARITAVITECLHPCPSRPACPSGLIFRQHGTTATDMLFGDPTSSDFEFNSRSEGFKNVTEIRWALKQPTSPSSYVPFPLDAFPGFFPLSIETPGLSTDVWASDNSSLLLQARIS